MADPLLISLSGLPGTGKSTIARALARELRAVWLRIDSVEQAIRDADVLRGEVDAAGYLAAQALAADNLRLGHIVIADCVNDWAPARQAWRDIAERVPAPVLDVHVVCSNIDEHRRRVETRETDVPGLRPPGWRKTMARVFAHEDRPPSLVVDTAGVTVEASVLPILQAVRSTLRDHSPGASSAASPDNITAPR